jgi:hypothetical protein
MPRAAALAAQLRNFAGRRTVVRAFLWPSGRSILRYFNDVANAEAPVDSFVRLVERKPGRGRLRGTRHEQVDRNWRKASLAAGRLDGSSFGK